MVSLFRLLFQSSLLLGHFFVLLETYTWPGSHHSWTFLSILSHSSSKSSRTSTSAGRSNGMGSIRSAWPTHIGSRLISFPRFFFRLVGQWCGIGRLVFYRQGPIQSSKASIISWKAFSWIMCGKRNRKGFSTHTYHRHGTETKHGCVAAGWIDLLRVGFRLNNPGSQQIFSFFHLDTTRINHSPIYTAPSLSD